MHKEDLAEYIIKNLIFISLFILSVFYVFNAYLLPEVQSYKDKKADLIHTDFVFNQAIEKNNEITQTIKKTQEENSPFLQTLQTPIHLSQIQAVAQDFFKVKSLRKTQKTPNGMFEDNYIELKGESNGIKAFFDCIKKLKNTFPNITISLPFKINKEDPLLNTLEVTLHLKVTQLNEKSIKK